MANHFRLFGRPLSADEVEPSLSVTGELEGYVAGEAYESRLQINNSVGRCSVEIIEATLPDGATVRVDNVTKEVVVKWAEWTVVEEEISDLPNGNFELGDNGAWVPGDLGAGAGWSIGEGAGYDANDGTHSARFANVRIEISDLVSAVFPAKVNDNIRVSAMVQQGATSAGKAGARVDLIYVDVHGAELLRAEGNLVNSGKNSAWHETSVQAAAPALTAGVRVSIAAFRNRQNHPLWVDTVKWNHKYTLGQQLSDQTYYLHIKVRDSANRVAYWEGTIEEFLLPLTGQLLPFFEYESVSLSATPVAMNWKESPSVSTSEAVSLTATPISLVFRMPVTAYSDVESVSLTATPLSMNWRSVVVPANSTESVSLTATPQSINYKTHIAHSATPESVLLTATPLGMNYG